MPLTGPFYTEEEALIACGASGSGSGSGNDDSSGIDGSGSGSGSSGSSGNVGSGSGQMSGSGIVPATADVRVVAARRPPNGCTGVAVNGEEWCMPQTFDMEENYIGNNTPGCACCEAEEITFFTMTWDAIGEYWHGVPPNCNYFHGYDIYVRWVVNNFEVSVDGTTWYTVSTLPTFSPDGSTLEEWNVFFEMSDIGTDALQFDCCEGVGVISWFRFTTPLCQCP